MKQITTEQQKWIDMTSSLSYRELNILMLKHASKKTYESIGKNYGLSKERIRQIETEALKKLSLYSTIK
jgi:RNA polymerase sigma factor (sigma-70 family)